jgi:hypothetical protein
MNLNTKVLMSGSSGVMLLLGLLMTFAPQELMAYCGSTPQPLSVLIIQAAGALYLGFSMLNWMAREKLIGGIYSRPVAVGNLLHFSIFAAALLKAAAGGHRQPITMVAAFVYSILAGWFALVVFKSP